MTGFTSKRQMAQDKVAQPAQPPLPVQEPDDLTIAYMSGVYDGKKKRPWVGLAAEDRLCAKYMQDAPDGIEAVIDYIEAKLKELNT